MNSGDVAPDKAISAPTDTLPLEDKTGVPAINTGDFRYH
jgi:hypothetical protein